MHFYSRGCGIVYYKCSKHAIRWTSVNGNDNNYDTLFSTAPSLADLRLVYLYTFKQFKLIVFAAWRCRLRVWAVIIILILLYLYYNIAYSLCVFIKYNNIIFDCARRVLFFFPLVGRKEEKSYAEPRRGRARLLIHRHHRRRLPRASSSRNKRLYIIIHYIIKSYTY